jgi:sugar lactone lactonase YvrE
MRPALAVLALLTCALPAHTATITTFAGNGTKGLSGDGGPATAAQLADPAGIARGPDGALYICDTANHRIRKVTSDGRISTIAGTGEKGFSGDGGPATAAKLAEPYEVRFDRAGNIYWVERLSHSFLRVDAKRGTITTVAGNGTAGFSGDAGPATQAQLNEPHSIAFDSAGDLFIADVKNHRIRKVVMQTGLISTVIGNGKRDTTPDGATIDAATPIAGPRALAFDRTGGLWVALREGNAVLRLDLARGIAHRVAGTGAKGASGDGGPASAATLNGPKGIAVGPDGRIYLADTENHLIRAIDLRAGTITRVAGTGRRGAASPGNPLDCALNRPHGIFVDADGTVFIGDTEAQCVLQLHLDH